MSKILIVEPQRMLQHALVAALAPEYELQLVAELGKVGAEFDAQVVDVAALRAAGAWNQQALTALKITQLPTVLLDGAEPVEITERAGLVRLQAPIDRDGLRAALRQCLGGAGEKTAPAKPRPKRARPAPVEKASAAELATVPAGAQAAVIELTEVVEED